MNNTLRIAVSLFLITLAVPLMMAKELRVLAIGNSFSRDAIEQNLHELAAADGHTAIIGNLFIGGCSLARHVDNLRADRHDYVYRKIGADGVRVERSGVSIAEALADDDWDMVSVQQASPESGVYATYAASLPELVEYVRKRVDRDTKVILHQTWAYARDARHTGFRKYGRDQMTMYDAIVDATSRAAKASKIKTVVPAGTAIQNARTSFIGDRMNRDGYHLDYAVGRFTAACAWYEKLFGGDVRNNAYAPAGMNQALARVARESAHAAVMAPGRVTDMSHLPMGDSPLYKDASVPVEIRVDDLLGRMTLDEKVMQLNQYTLGRNNNVNNVGEEVKKLPAEIGSVIYFDTDPALRNDMQRRAMNESRLGIPIVFGFDVIHGFRTVYPISLAQACSWNPGLVRQACAVAAQEARMSGVDWTFSPMIDVARDPRWGRVAEGYGEDPYANSVFGAASVRGYQGGSLADSVTVAAGLKHYVAYGASEAGRDYVYTEVSPQTLWDTYLPPYEAGVKAGAATLMSSFNDISGVPGSANRYTMTEILKQKWGHDGFIVSDWGAIEQLKNQGLAADKKQAAELAFNAGLEMDMMSHAYDRHLADLVAEGRVSEEAIDDAVRRVLRLKFRLGLFEKPYTDDYPDRFLRQSSLDVAGKLASESMVLMKNDKALLPLAGKKRIAVIGPMALDGGDLLGSWFGHGRPEDVELLYDGMVKEFGDSAELRHAAGCWHDGDDRSGFAEAVGVARWSDVVVLCVGEMRKWSGENASRASIALPAIQEDLVMEVAKAGKPIVLVVSSGRPVELCRLDSLSDAILEIWQPGVNGASAMAGILSGRINPSGKLAMTFPYSTGQIPIYYNRRGSGRRHQGFYQDVTSEPMYAFGHGLSYTSYSYGDIKVSKADIRRGERITATVEVTNTGDRAGDETVMWFVADPYCSVTRPVKELKYFEKKHIAPGETVTYTFRIDPLRDLGFVDASGRKFLEAGEYHIMVNDRKVTINLTD
ncbi:MAG: DUF4886 domain-containing protein [Muribaculaceae bacterium]|nr:DUF4886 domain-containing protein [Muribaculaceae bacterium]